MPQPTSDHLCLVRPNPEEGFALARISCHEPTHCERSGHSVVVTYGRPWRRMLRKTHYLRCWDCDLRVLLETWPGQDSVRLITDAFAVPTVPYGDEVDG